MKNEKSQTMKIIDGFVTTVVILTAATLVASGVSVSRMNTEYLETGVRSAKIVAEKDSRQIFVANDDSVLLTPQRDYSIIGKIMSFLPPPVNTAYLAVKEIRSSVFEPD